MLPPNTTVVAMDPPEEFIHLSLPPCYLVKQGLQLGVGRICLGRGLAVAIRRLGGPGLSNGRAQVEQGVPEALAKLHVVVQEQVRQLLKFAGASDVPTLPCPLSILGELADSPGSRRINLVTVRQPGL
ncbi:MAG TPA: hypothetical protein VFS96_04210 [Nitrolancea sp.]|nr:hypothetical protein [Nitrolancea sp.]